MTFEARMAAYLADSTITALVGTRAGPVNAGQQPDLPYVAWQRVVTAPTVTHDAAEDFDEVMVQVDCFASTHAAACAIRRAVRSVVVGDGNTSENAQDLGHDDDRQSYGVSIDFTIWHDDSGA